MKTTLFALLLLAASPLAMADAPTVSSPTAPVVQANGGVEILMADGSARRVRKILGMTPDSLRIMTDEGIGKIPLKALHPAALTALDSMKESPEEYQARKQREAAAAQSYRENQATKERMAAEENATRGAALRAEEARQEAARQAAAQAYAQQQQQMREHQAQQNAERAERKAERDAARLAEERAQALALERQRQYNLDAAVVQALQGLSDAAQLEVLRQMGYIK